ncbi:acyltransferase family protein [Lacipirellula sp.]|uniref:acyltransferase family protein n=1 Tax=Lacipirellula sp. TaxID=2691419 RepID=UPI003D0D8D3E
MSTDSPAATKPPRLLSLDAFRGMTVIGMVMANNPGSWAAGERYAPLDHAAWHGWTPTDWIFPLFLFIMGTSLAYSMKKYREGAAIDPAVYTRIIRRTILLFGLGLFSVFFGRLLSIAMREDVAFSYEAFHFDTFRILGVLQRIALVYLVASLLVLHTGLRTQVVVGAALLLGYWGLLATLPPESDYQTRLTPEGNVVRVVDIAVLGSNHMYTQAKSEKTEPEGLLSTLPAIVNTLLGYWVGLAIMRYGANWGTVGRFVIIGAVMAAIGLAWGEVFPINKKLWTSSFVLFTSGVGTIGLGLCLGLFDVAGYRKLARPFEIVGINAIFIFVGSGLLSQLLGAISAKVTAADGTIETTSAKGWIYKELITDHIADPKLASFLFAAATVAFWWIILWGMARRGWSVRV